MSRIGIYGGSFNPPHAGHVLAAAQSVQRLQLDRLLVIPAYDPPHKQQAEGTPDAETRLALTRLAFAGIPEAEVSDIEIRREGVSYTVDTLRSLRSLYPDDELILLMGTDMLLSFLTWRAPQQIASMAKLAVMHRQNESEQLRAEVQAAAQQIEQTCQTQVLFAENESIEVSSTEIRRMLAFGVPEYRLPQAVGERIREKQLYGCGVDRRGLPFEELKAVPTSSAAARPRWSLLSAGAPILWQPAAPAFCTISPRRSAPRRSWPCATTTRRRCPSLSGPIPSCCTPRAARWWPGKSSANPKQSARRSGGTPPARPTWPCWTKSSILPITWNRTGIFRAWSSCARSAGRISTPPSAQGSRCPSRACASAVSPSTKTPWRHGNIYQREENEP